MCQVPDAGSGVRSWRNRWITTPVLLLCLSTSCYVVRHEYDGARQLTPGTKLTGPSESVGEIAGSKVVPYLLFGWIRLADSSGPRLAEELGVEAVGEGGFIGITRLHITDEENALGVICRVLTLGLFGMYQVSVTGDLQRLR